MSLESRATALVLALVIASACLLLAAETTVWDRDEARFAGQAVEMGRSGQYLYPTLEGEIWLEYPVLVTWLMAMAISVLGPSAIAVRSCSVLATAATAYATYLIGRRLVSPRVGLLAMLVVAFNPLMLVEGTAATADAVLIAFITCAMAGLVWRLTSTVAVWPAVLFGGALAGALLTKGPVGLLPILVGAGVLWPRRNDRRSRAIAGEFGAAALVGLAVFCGWALLADRAAGGRLLSSRFLLEHVSRPVEGHGGNLLLWLPFYPAVAIVGLAPWSPYLPAALHRLWQGDERRPDLNRLLVWWIACPFVAFTVAVTKLPHYVLPAWPALAIAVAIAAAGAFDAQDDRNDASWLRGGVALAVIPAAVMLAALAAAQFLAHSPGLAWSLVPAELAMVVMLPLIVTSLHRGRWHAALAMTIAAAVLLPLVAAAGLSRVEALKPVPRLAATILSRADSASTVATLGFDEPSLTFVLQRIPQRLRTVDEVNRWSEESGRGFLVTTRSLASQAAWPRRLIEIGASSGLNVVDGRTLELVAFERPWR